MALEKFCEDFVTDNVKDKTEITSIKTDSPVSCSRNSTPLCKLEVQYRVHKSPALNPFREQTNAVHLDTL